MEDFLLGQRTLQIWIDGGELNVGATTKDVVNITKARDEINKRFLMSIWMETMMMIDTTAMMIMLPV